MRNISIVREFFYSGTLLIILSGAVMAQNPQSFYPPPLANGKHDFAGLRFIIHDENGNVVGSRPPVLRKGFILKRERRRGDLQPPGSSRYYLARDKIQKDGKKDDEGDGDHDDKGDTLIRYVRNLNDLRGFVKIRTETDALEFLRFGSSLMGYQLFEVQIKEVFCIRSQDTPLIPDPIVSNTPAGVPWATEHECQRLNFFPPKILNPLATRGKAAIEDDDGDEIEDNQNRRGKSKHFFLIERTVHASLMSPLTQRGKPKFLRILEEVGPAGQWRIITTSEIPVSAQDHKEIISR